MPFLSATLGLPSSLRARPQTAPVRGTQPPGGLRTLLRFGGLSGCGWLLDVTLLYGLVRGLHLAAGLANLLSASTAGIVVYLVAHRLVFGAPERAPWRATAVYAAYTVAVILLCSWAIEALATALLHLSAGPHPAGSFYALSPASCSLVAKCMVTPFNFAANFAVARLTSRRHAATAAL